MAKMQPKRIPVLFCGSVNGQFKSLFKIVAKLSKDKGPFEALYCVGNFFNESSPEWESVKNGTISAPIPCYILGPSSTELEKFYPNSNGMELAPNIIYLGKKGILTTSGGLKIVYLSGVEGPNASDHEFTAKDSLDLQNNFQGLFLRGSDFLLTTQWPKHVTKGANTPDNFDSKVVRSSGLISYLAATAKPCYHFAGLGEIFYERTPYRNSKTFEKQVSHSTRFLGLGAVGNPKKIRFLYAISHVPLHTATEEFLKNQLKNEINTECPYKGSIESEEISPQTQLLDYSSQEFKRPRRNDHEGDKKKSTTTPSKCWFCLRFPVEKHLIVSVGLHCYISFAKGWIVPGHLLIISHSHHKSTTYLSYDALEELNDLKYMIRQYFERRNKKVVFFERNYKSFHLQLQAVPLPTHLNERVESAFLNAADERGLVLEEVPPDSIMKQVVGQKKPFFCLEIDGHNGSRPKKFVCIIESEFPIGFDREVLTSRQLLNLPDRVDWKKCSLPLHEEVSICNQFREDFLKFQSSS